ncbi:nucleoporin Nup88 [Acrasis kona]|uniref:Nucleoporin Nup88 n=1 Tax=Acrasis kona TaxID=1008807 RepID=A0AAW2ZS13_9EUKA
MTKPHQHKTPQPSPFNIKHSGDQLKSFIKNVCDIEVIESDVLSILVATETAQVCSFISIQNIQPAWVSSASSRGDHSVLLAVDVVDLSLGKSTLQCPYLMRHPIDKITMYCSHANGIHSLRYPFLQSLAAEESVEYKPCISKHIINLPGSPNFSFICDALVGAMCVALHQCQFVVINVIAEIFTVQERQKNKHPSLAVQSSRVAETEFEKQVKSLYNKSLEGSTSKLTTSQDQNIELLNKVSTEFNENAFEFCQLVNMAISEKMRQIKKTKTKQSRDLDNAQKTINAQTERRKQQLSRIKKILSAQKELNKKSEQLLSTVQYSKPDSHSKAELDVTLNYWKDESVRLQESIDLLKDRYQECTESASSIDGVFSKQQTAQIYNYLSRTFSTIKSATAEAENLENKINNHLMNALSSSLQDTSMNNTPKKLTRINDKR